MKRKSQHILRGILLSAIATMFGNNANSQENESPLVYPNDDNETNELSSSSGRIYKNVLKMSPSGNIIAVNSHRSHSSHSSHSSHRSGSYTRSHSSHTSHTSHSSSSTGYGIPSRSTSTRTSSSNTSTTRSTGYGTGTSTTSSTNNIGISSLYSNPSSSSLNPKTIELGSRNLMPELYGNDINKLVKLLAEKLYIRENWVSKKDGYMIYDSKVEEAVKHFQKDASIPQTGQLDKTALQTLKTWNKEKTTISLGVRDLFFTEGETISGQDVEELATLLWAKGLTPSPSLMEKHNGHTAFTRDLEMAVKLFQKYNNMPETGIVDEKFVQFLKGISKNTSKVENNTNPTMASSSLSYNNDNDERILDVPEECAEFPGDVYSWIQKNIQYPDICRQQNIQGRVSMQFVINKDGSIVDAKALRSPDPNLSQEAIRLIGSMPKWKPARENGKPVRMRYVLPVMFRL